MMCQERYSTGFKHYWAEQKAASTIHLIHILHRDTILRRLGRRGSLSPECKMQDARSHRCQMRGVSSVQNLRTTPGGVVEYSYIW